MERESKRKVILVVVAAVCLAVAGVTMFSSLRDGSGGIESLKSGVMFWMKCKDCGNEWQIDRKEYYSFMEKDPLIMRTPAMQCPNCKEEGGYLAHKCPKCDNMFFDHAYRADDYGDRCPKCMHSEKEEASIKQEEASKK